jgi:hypothetical protein
MRKKTTLNLGIAAMALSASLFLGCQDFLSEDKSVQSAKTSSETAKDMPAIAADTAKPAASEPATPAAPVATPSAPATPDNAAECKEIYAQMQTAKDPLYGEFKNKFTNLNCDLSKAAGPYVPPDSATLCKNLRATLAMLDPNSPKYPMYQQDIATYCTDALTPAAPVATPSAPAAPDNAAECKEIYAQMQTAKDPLYGELKDKITNLNCDLSKAAGPYVPPAPPDSATVCKNLQASLAVTDPAGSKYASFLQEIASYCTAKP